MSIKKNFYSGFLPEINYRYSEDFIKSYPEFFIWIKSNIINSRDKDILLLKSNLPIRFAILKYSEKKICFYLLPYFRGKGYSSLLLEKSIKELNTNYPLVTVSELVKDDFINLFSKYNFRLITELDNLYRENSVEYICNKEFKK